MKNPKHAATQRISRAVRVIGIAGIGLGVALGSAAVSTAEPSWDLEDYDFCMSKDTTDPTFDVDRNSCCLASGGVCDAKINDCVAPPVETPAGRSPHEGTRPPSEPGMTFVPVVHPGFGVTQMSCDSPGAMALQGGPAGAGNASSSRSRPALPVEPWLSNAHADD